MEKKLLVLIIKIINKFQDLSTIIAVSDHVSILTIKIMTECLYW